MAKSMKSELDQHTDALNAHTAALTKHARVLAAIAAASAPTAFPPAGTVIWTNSNCVDGQREIWVADGTGGFEKKHVPC